MSRALVLTYHAVERGPAPLCVDPDLFRAQLDCILETGATVVTISELARLLRARELRDQTVAITFDDGFRSVVANAVPLLVERGVPATIFCVAGFLGTTNAWPSARSGGYEAPLATATELHDLSTVGIEIGSHGMEHAPLVPGVEQTALREIVESKLALEDILRTEVTSYALPYGAGPTAESRQLIAETYDAACTTRLGAVERATNVYALPRIDSHYLRQPALLRRALTGSLDVYLGLRRMGARTRRALVKDYTLAELR